MDIETYIEGLVSNNMDWEALFESSPAVFFATIAVILASAVVIFIAECLIFKKARQSLYVLRVLIPIVNTYTEFKISYGRAKFWSMLFSIIIGCILFALTVVLPAGNTAKVIMIIAALVLFLIAAIIALIQRFKLAKAFGKSGLFGLGILFFPAIFYLILGFGKCEYKGLQR